jgi:epoxide hydrolase-like predicted phosphatase
VERRAVIFDLGGVILGSPLHAIAAYEREHGVTPGAINRVVVDTGPAGAWSRLERGELPMEDFYPAFEGDCAAAGHRISARDLMQRMAGAAKPRPQMLEAVRRLRSHGLRTAALTNNWPGDHERQEPLKAHFDAFVESSVVGLRKPDPAIYHHVCAEIEVAPPEAIFLDDIGSNLKTARALGMATIKVEDPDEALRALEALVALALLE